MEYIKIVFLSSFHKRGKTTKTKFTINKKMSEVTKSKNGKFVLVVFIIPLEFNGNI